MKRRELLVFFCIALSRPVIAPLAAQVLPNDIPDILVQCPNQVGAGQTQNISSPTTLDCLAIKGTVNLTAKLSVGTIYIYPGGTLTCRPPAQIMIRDLPFQQNDSERYGNGIVTFGTRDCQGTMKTPWTRLWPEMSAGQNAITLNPAPSGWLVGDEISITDSRNLPMSAYAVNGDQWPKPERFKLVSGSGANWTLDHSAAFEHPCMRHKDGAPVQGRCAVVANHTRDVKIYSENPNGNRGHIMDTGDAKVTEKYVENRNMGRTVVGLFSDVNRKGRYADHSHMMSAVATVNKTGNAIIDGTKWPLTIHSSHNGLYSWNVIVGGDGSGCYTEVGDERDNIIEFNYCAGIKGSGARADHRCTGDGTTMGCEGSAGWMQGSMNRVRNNIFANSLDCFVQWSYANGAFQPIKELSNNEYIGCRDGSQFWETFGGGDDTGTTCWNMTLHCFYGYTMAGIRLVDWTVRQDPRVNQTEANEGCIWFGDYGAFDTTILRPNIQNCNIGIRGIYGISGGPRDPWWSWPISKLTVQDGTFDNNERDFYFWQAPLASGGGGMSYEIRLIGNTHGSMSRAHNVRVGPLQAEQTGSVHVYVQDYQKDPAQDYEVFSNETAPGNAVTRSKFLDKVVTSAPPPPGDTDGDGVPDSSDKCPGTPAGSVVDSTGCVVPPQTTAPSTSTITVLSGPTTIQNGQILWKLQSVEGPSGTWQKNLWGTDTFYFNVTVIPGSGALPVILFLHGAGGASPSDRAPVEFIDAPIAAGPGIYINPVSTWYVNGAIDPVTGASRGEDWWMGYADSNGIFQPITMDRVIRYVQWVLQQTSKWNPDPTRVYVKGGSMGGGGAQKYALHNPTLFAAGVPGTGWIDLNAWTNGSYCKPGMKWRVSTGLLCTDMHDSVYLVNNMGGRKIPLYLTWGSDDTLINPARYPELIALLDTKTHPYMAEWRATQHTYFDIVGNPWLQMRLGQAPSMIAPTGNNPATTAAGSRRNMNISTQPDSDGDGVPDSSDSCAGTPAGTPVGPDGCPVNTGGNPVVTIQAPATVQQPNSVAFTSGCDTCVNMTMFVDGQDTGQFQNSPPWNWTFNSASYTAGAHVIRINGRDASNRTGFADHTITVTTATGDTTKPIVTLAVPASPLKGTVTLTATCSDLPNPSCTSVQFVIDGANVGSPVTASPYSFTLDTTTLANTTHTFSIVGLDAAGNQGTLTTPVSRTVDNSVPQPSAFAVTVTIKTCEYKASDVPPDTSLGWGVQFQRRLVGSTSWTNHGQKDSTAPYERAVTLAAGQYEFQAVWSKSGASSVTRAPIVKGCQ